MNKGKIKFAEDYSYYNYLKENGFLLFESIVGSHAYGISTEKSDIDKKFVFIEPLDAVLNGTAADQLNIMGDDHVGFELGRFIAFLEHSNPNILDLLHCPEDCILTNTPIYQKYFIDNRQNFLTKKCAETFGNYAATQIQKARGTNKKIVNPFPEERKGLLDFCWVAIEQGAEPLIAFLKRKRVHHIDETVGIVAIDHMKNTYHLFYDTNYAHFLKAIDKDPSVVEDIFCSNPGYKGIVDKDNVQIVLSSVEKGMKPLTTFYCNIEGFQTYCKEYKEYWNWVENRNEGRYQQNVENGADYDAKNLAHCIRLLDMCVEILRDGQLIVRRPNREELLKIRRAGYTYDQLIEMAESRKALIQELKETSPLPEVFSKAEGDALLLKMRKEIYNL